MNKKRLPQADCHGKENIKRKKKDCPLGQSFLLAVNKLFVDCAYWTCSCAASALDATIVVNPRQIFDEEEPEEVEERAVEKKNNNGKGKQILEKLKNPKVLAGVVAGVVLIIGIICYLWRLPDKPLHFLRHRHPACTPDYSESLRHRNDADRMRLDQWI